MFSNTFFPAREVSAVGGSSGGLDLLSLQAFLDANGYVTQQDLPAPVDVSGKADTSYVDTQLATKSETDHLHTGVYAPETGSTVYATKAEIPDLSGALTTAQADDRYASQTALEEKMDTAEFDVRVNPFISNWLTTYINTNPNSWVTLRTLLQYYPLTYSTWTSPVNEYVARPGESNARTWKQITDATNNNNTLPSLHSANIAALAAVGATATKPYAFQRNGGGTNNTYATFFQWYNKGTFFWVYSWPAAPAANRMFANTLGNTGTGISDGGARCRLTRTQFTISLEAGGHAVYNGPPVADTEINVPYVMGFSWDFTIDPPRFCWINQRYAIEHIGPNEPTELLEITDTALIPTPATSWNIPYTAYHASASRGATLAFFGTTQAPEAAVHWHWFGRWNTYMDMEQARTVHMRLIQRYCVPPFPTTNYRLQDNLPEVVTPPPPE